MKKIKNLGIWMDHSNAHIIDLSIVPITTTYIKSDSNLVSDIEYSALEESHNHNREQRILTAFFKKLSDIILPFDNVLLFGPTDAKNELSNFLNENQFYLNKQIEIKSTCKMTENQEFAFVKNHFNND